MKFLNESTVGVQHTVSLNIYHNALITFTLLCRRPHRAEALSDAFFLTSVAYIGRNSSTERPRKTKIATEVAHVTRDSDTTFKVKRSTVNLLLMS